MNSNWTCLFLNTISEMPQMRCEVIIANRWLLLDRSDRRATVRRRTGRKATSRVLIRCWNPSVYDRTTLRHCLQYEGNHERGSRTDDSFRTKLKRIARYFKGRQRCVLNLTLGEKAGRRHQCDRGYRLGWRPEDKVLHVWWSVGKWSVLHSSTLVCDNRQQYRYPQPNQRPRRSRRVALKRCT